MNYTEVVSRLLSESVKFDAPENFLERVLVDAASALNTERASVWLYSNDLSVIDNIILYEKSKERFSHNAESLNSSEFQSYAEIHKQAGIVAVSNVLEDPLTKDIPTEYFQEHGIRSLVDVPIWLNDELRGLLSFEHVGYERVWSQEEKQFAQNMSLLISFSLQTHFYIISENERLQSERRFFRALENIPDVVAIYGRDLEILYINEATKALTGKSSEDLIGLHDEEIWPSEVYEAYLPALRIALETGEYRELRTTIDIPGIGPRYLLIKIIPQLDGTGKSNELMVVTTDLTEHYAKEQELILSEQRYRSLFENMSSGFVLFEPVLNDSGDTEDLTVLAANEGFAEATGLTVQDVIGKRLTSVLPGIENDEVDWIKIYCEVARGGASKEFEQKSELLGAHFKLIAYQPAQNQCAVNFTDITDRVAAEIALRNSLTGTIEAVSNAVEARDPYTAGHQKRVALIACAIAAEMGLDKHTIDGIKMGAEIHDIGKIRVPSAILSRPGKLADYEIDLIKAHSQIGFDILKNIEFPWPIAKIAHQHHERLDGSGYPLGLEGDEIILEARIVAVADVIEAISSDRPYRAGLGLEAAFDEIRNKRGTIYDAKVVDACLRAYENGAFS